MHDRRHDLNAPESGVPARTHPPEPHGRRHDLHAAAAPDDHAGERDVALSARSLAARGDALDASEDGPREKGDAGA